jgi:hypothetical protein
MIAGEREFAPARPPEVIVERGCSWVARANRAMTD